MSDSDSYTGGVPTQTSDNYSYSVAEINVSKRRSEEGPRGPCSSFRLHLPRSRGVRTCPPWTRGPPHSRRSSVPFHSRSTTVFSLLYPKLYPTPYRTKGYPSFLPPYGRGSVPSCFLCLLRRTRHRPAEWTGTDSRTTRTSSFPPRSETYRTSGAGPRCDPSFVSLQLVSSKSATKEFILSFEGFGVLVVFDPSWGAGWWYAVVWIHKDFKCLPYTISPLPAMVQNFV